jgi:pre-mRNA-processing factor 19
MAGLLRCEISGEMMSAIDDPFVVTPSGHIAKRRLLLQKLLENGGIDPFYTPEDMGEQQERRRPLSEDDFIELQQQMSSSSSTNTSSMLPPLPRSVIQQQNNTTNTTNGINGGTVATISSGSDMGSLVKLVQMEYDSIVLELFDTRKQLQHVRQELSHALYQNDAAVRVIARLVAERNEARAHAQRTSLMTTSSTTTNSIEQQQASKRPRLSEEGNEEEETDSKQSKVPIPSSDLDVMLSTWDQLHSSRKGRQKAASKQALPLSTFTNPDAYRAMTISINTDSENENTADAVAATIITGARLICSSTATHDIMCITGTKVMVLSKESNSFTTNIETKASSTASESPSSVISCIDSDNKHKTLLHAMGLHSGRVLVYNNTNQIGSLATVTPNVSEPPLIVDVRIHPDLIHIIATTSDGVVHIARINSNDNTSDEVEDTMNMETAVEWVAKFQIDTTNDNESITYTAGALHPDGLIYITGTASGELHIWDFKSQVCAERLHFVQHANSTTTSTSVSVRSISISNNGYHVAVIYSNNTVVVWDLRKLQVVATLNEGDDSAILHSTSSVVFDNSGKYLAYSGIAHQSSDKDDDTASKLATAVVAVVNVKDWTFVTSLQVTDSTIPISKSSQITTSGITWGNDNKITILWCTSTLLNDNPSQERRYVAVFQENSSKTE